MHVYEFNSSSGLFLAEGSDSYGVSGLIGGIEDDRIQFKKVYVGSQPECPGDWIGRFNEIEFTGIIRKPDSGVTIGGAYHPIGSNETYDGNWRLDSVSK